MGAIGLLDPRALLAFPVLLVLLVLLAFRESERKRRLRILGLAEVAAPITALVCAVIVPALCIIALLRPYLGASDVKLSLPGRDYMFVVDVSQSMLARDIPPSRMELARRKLKDLTSVLSHRGGSNRFGITLFAGDAYLFCPLTADLTVIDQFITYISPSMVTSFGSNLEAGIGVALDRFEKSRTKGGRILLISDGEDDRLVVDRVIQMVKDKGVVVDVLGVGTTEGSPITLETGTFLKDNRGTTVISRLNEDSLRSIAQESGGAYVRAGVSDEDVEQLAAKGLLDLDKAYRGERTIRSYSEIGPFIALVALLTMLAFSAWNKNGIIFRVALLATILSISSGARADDSSAPLIPKSAAEEARDGYELYNSGRFEDARRAFESALHRYPDDPAIKQGLASAEFKLGQVAESARHFAELAEAADDGKSYFENTYNQGNALLAQKKYADAIDAYSKALDVKPGDTAAAHNREIARKLLEQENQRKNQPTPTPSPQKGTTATPTPSSKPSPNQTAEPTPTSGSPTPDSGTPDPEASPSPQPSVDPSAAPTPDDGSGESAPPTTTPAGSPSPQATEAGGGDPNAPSHPNPEANMTPQETPSDAPSSDSPPEDQSPLDRLKEALDALNDTPKAQPNTPEEVTGRDDKSAFDTKEADAWLESLPDSPLLLRKKRGDPRRHGQSW